jgi:phosphate transport system substrate-binding protein
MSRASIASDSRPVLSVKGIVLFALTLAPFAGCGGRIEPVVLDGSSTVYRVSKVAQVWYDKVDPETDVIVESHGTGGGFSRYLQGEADIVNASRKAKPVEEAKAVGDKAWTRFIVGHDGITVVVNPSNDFVNELTLDQLKTIWEPGSKVRTWRDVDPRWPDRRITFFSPDKDSGTFEFFTEAVVHKARSQRDDIQASPDDNTLVRGVSGDKDSLGYFGYAHYMANSHNLKAVKLVGKEGVPVGPSRESILSGAYPALSRPLFVYAKNSALARPQVRGFLDYYLNNVSDISERAGYVGPTEGEIRDNLGAFRSLVERTAPATPPRNERAE